MIFLLTIVNSSCFQHLSKFMWRSKYAQITREGKIFKQEKQKKMKKEFSLDTKWLSSSAAMIKGKRNIGEKSLPRHLPKRQS